MILAPLLRVDEMRIGEVEVKGKKDEERNKRQFGEGTILRFSSKQANAAQSSLQTTT